MSRVSKRMFVAHICIEIDAAPQHKFIAQHVIALQFKSSL